ncbi:MAG: RND transporter, partial [Cytophagales bacterium]
DPTLRPSMTTSNKIVAQVLPNVVYVPLESLHLHHDSVTYVFKKDGISINKQEVMVGENNSNEVVILAGIEANDQVYLSMPKDKEKDDVSLLPQLDGKRQKKNKPVEEIKKDEPKTADANVK